jgi:hypothetical protein
MLGGLLGSIVQNHQLAVAERELSVGMPLVIGELHLEDAGSKDFDDSADLATEQAPLGQIGGESNDIKESNGVLEHGHNPGKNNSP